LVDDAAYDEWELDTEPTSQDPDAKRSPKDLIDEVLRDAQNDGPRREGKGGDDSARPS
jgi:hypothetical protein